MTDLSVIILVGKEKIHMRRCMEKLAPLMPKNVFVITSQPDDGTEAIAREMGAKVVFHAWPGLYAKQFNWALDALGAFGANEKSEVRNEKCGEWILRLDADEYLTPDTIEKLAAAKGLADLPDSVAGLTLELERRFCGGEIRYVTNGIRPLRLWRRGRGKSEEREMDEHIAIDGISDFDELRRLGKVADFDGAFYDDNLTVER